MNRWIVTAALGLLLLCYAFFTTGKKAEKEYAMIMQEATLSLTQPQELTEKTRSTLRKEIWFAKGGKRLCCRIFSDQSELTFLSEGRILETIEHFDGAYCICQEKLGPNNLQEVCALRAEEADYNYATEVLVAKRVHIYKFRLSGEELPEDLSSYTPVMAGVAQSAEVRLKGEGATVRFSDFEATLQPSRIR